MTTVLILVADESIGDLLWRYVELALHAPAFPFADEGAADAIARVGPSLILLDASLGVDALPLERVAAARSIPVVYVSSAMSDSELRMHAAERGAPHAPLSGGARRLAETLREVLSPEPADHSRLHPSLVAAAALDAHSRFLGERSRAARETSQVHDAEQEITLALCRERGAGVRQVLSTLAHSLRVDGVPAERAITIMRGAVLNALDASGGAQDAHPTLEAAERCWRAEFRGA